MGVCPYSAGSCIALTTPAIGVVIFFGSLLSVSRISVAIFSLSGSFQHRTEIVLLFYLEEHTRLDFWMKGCVSVDKSDYFPSL